MSRLARRLLAGVSLAALAVGLLAGPAAAHVTVNAPDARAGGFTVLTFRVPNERDVPTVGLKVQFPSDQPLQSVSVKPKAGWEYVATKATLDAPIEGSHGDPITEAMSTVEWTSTTGIRPGEFDEFQVSAGPLPDAEQMVFKVIQVYQGGEEVAWIQEPTPGGAEPDRPAPVLRLAAADQPDADADDADDAADAAEDRAEAAADGDDSDGASATVALVVGSLGLLAGLAALALSLMARRSPTRNTAGS